MKAFTHTIHWSGTLNPEPSCGWFLNITLSLKIIFLLREVLLFLSALSKQKLLPIIQGNIIASWIVCIPNLKLSLYLQCSSLDYKLQKGRFISDISSRQIWDLWMYNISMHARISDISEFHLLLDFFGKSRRWNSASPRVYFFLLFFLNFFIFKGFSYQDRGERRDIGHSFTLVFVTF